MKQETEFQSLNIGYVRFLFLAFQSYDECL